MSLCFNIAIKKEQTTFVTALSSNVISYLKYFYQYYSTVMMSASARRDFGNAAL